MIDMKLQESYNYLSKSPIKTDEVDENVGGALRGAPLYVLQASISLQAL